MSKAFRKYFNQKFSQNIKNGDGALLSLLAWLKKIQPVEVYSDLQRSLLENCTPSVAGRLTNGRISYRDLMWNASSEDNTLSKEFEFAVQWLQRVVPILNDFRAVAMESQKLIIGAQYERALELIVNYRNSMGWTIWGVELEFAIVSMFMSSQESRAYLTKITDNSSPRIASLLGQILRDRNDTSFSIGNFIKKCAATLPQTGLKKSAQDYILYRATATIKDVEESAAPFLTIDCNNSPIDYYETLIELCTNISIRPELAHLLEIVILTVRKLIDSGVRDFRLGKLIGACGGDPSLSEEEAPDPSIESIVCSLYSRKKTADFTDSAVYYDLISRIDLINEKGSVAQQEIYWLYAFGLNFRGIPIGAAVLDFATGIATSISLGGVCAPRVKFASPKFRLEDILSLPTERSKKLITYVRALNHDDRISDRCETLLNELESNELPKLENFDSPLEMMFLVKALVDAGRFAQAFKVIHVIESLDSPWPTHASKLRILCAFENGDLDTALVAAARIIVQDDRYGYELPLGQFFYRGKWKSFSGFDPVVVAIVSAQAYAVTDDSSCQVPLDHKRA